jgi:hypothetical protein
MEYVSISQESIDMKDSGEQMCLMEKESKFEKECVNIMASSSMTTNLDREHTQSTDNSRIMNDSETISFQEKEK